MTSAHRWFDSFVYDGQAYERTGDQPYTRRDGQQTTVCVWQSVCRVCHEPWQFIRTDKPAPGNPPRQCRSCAAKVREAKAKEMQTGRYNITSKTDRYRRAPRLTSETAPFVPAWLAGETGHPAPRTEGPAGSQDVLQGAPAANVVLAVRPPKARQTGATKRGTIDKRSAFTDR